MFHCILQEFYTWKHYANETKRYNFILILFYLSIILFVLYFLDVYVWDCPFLALIYDLYG